MSLLLLAFPFWHRSKLFVEKIIFSWNFFSLACHLMKSCLRLIMRVLLRKFSSISKHVELLIVLLFWLINLASLRALHTWSFSNKKLFKRLSSWMNLNYMDASWRSKNFPWSIYFTADIPNLPEVVLAIIFEFWLYHNSSVYFIFYV